MIRFFSIILLLIVTFLVPISLYSQSQLLEEIAEKIFLEESVMIKLIPEAEQKVSLHTLLSKLNKASTSLNQSQWLTLIETHYPNLNPEVDALKSHLHEFNKYSNNRNLTSFEKAIASITSGNTTVERGPAIKPIYITYKPILFKIDNVWHFSIGKSWSDHPFRGQNKYFRDSVLKKYKYDICNVSEICVDLKEKQLKISFECKDTLGNKKTITIGSDGGFDLSFKTKDGVTYKLKQKDGEFTPTVSFDISKVETKHKFSKAPKNKE